jgi:2,5-diamino-6-(ribosylamino)-4(3H)-pyrimidinone 5'-phosphate reductase
MPVHLNMAVSLDGKIAPASREKVRLGTDRDIARMESLRAWADAIVVGAGTVRAEDPPMSLKDEEAVRARVAEGRPAHPAVVVVSASLRIEQGRLNREGGRLIVATCGDGEPPEGLEEVAEIWRLGSDRVDLAALVERLEAEGMDRILVEGGGRLSAGFLEEDLVDEIHQTVTPWLMGDHDAPTIASPEVPFAGPKYFDLVSMEGGEGEVFLTYRRASREGGKDVSVEEQAS